MAAQDIAEAVQLGMRLLLFDKLRLDVPAPHGFGATAALRSDARP
jgi:hypothetical protein